ncbi:ATP-binding cassette domain-containing protein [Cereibacter sphaeroides]|uniref:ATP-binding cassette domain-containing protein n=1 Tax=Cereibacter sphaeroides TaxID=1063 RepID=UPI002D7E8E06|nr:ATP-binding cassette domain-containing protein [Cereibacter sphaeroides]
MTAVAGIDLDIPRGKIFAIVGPNGAAKTSLLRVLEMLIPSSSAKRPRGMLFGGSIFARTAAFRSGGYTKRSSCPARLRIHFQLHNRR